MTDLQRFLKEAKSEIVALGKTKGFNITEDEVNNLADGQLSEGQLDAVAGGGEFNPQPEPPGRVSCSLNFDPNLANNPNLKIR